MSDIAKHDLSDLPRMAAALAQGVARPRAVATLCVVALTVIGWLYLALMHGANTDIFTAICQPLHGSVGLREFSLGFAMWAAMVLAMMVPSASATILTYAEIADTAARKQIEVVSPLVLTAGYTAVWLGFALAVTAAQVALANTTLFDLATGPLGRSASGVLFVGAGLYQFSVLKQACLRQCRNPFSFFFTNWTTTRRGVFRLGIKQGLYCLGCCWAAMLLMFALGVMNVVWMAVLAAAMTVEKLVNSTTLSYAFGAILVAAGLTLISGVGI